MLSGIEVAGWPEVERFASCFYPLDDFNVVMNNEKGVFTVTGVDVSEYAEKTSEIDASGAGGLNYQLVVEVN